MKKGNLTNEKKKLTKQIGYLETTFDTQFIPLQNEPSPVLVGPNLGGALGFRVLENITFQESSFSIQKINK